MDTAEVRVEYEDIYLSYVLELEEIEDVMDIGVYSAHFPIRGGGGKIQGSSWIWGRILGHFVSRRTKYETYPPYLEHFGPKQRI